MLGKYFCVVMLALSFLLLIGMVLVADGFEVHGLVLLSRVKGSSHGRPRW